MKSDTPLYLVASGPGAARVVRRSRSHLRLVRSAPLPQPAVLASPQPGVLALPLAAEAALRTRPARRSLSRPFGQRMVQAASDVALLAFALLVGLRPSA